MKLIGVPPLLHMNSDYPWHVLQTKPNNERKVARLLELKGYECFAPTYRQKRKWSDRAVQIDLPLFPGYIFCRFNSSALGKAVSTEGIVRILRFGERPAEVAIEEIEALQHLAQSDILREPWKYLPDGVIVLVETGPLAGVQGIICADENRRRLIISVTLLQRSVAIHLDEGVAISVIEDSRVCGARFSRESHLAIRLLRRT
jgi:transcription antitermination factor NusG